jgi:hypothetical protein
MGDLDLMTELMPLELWVVYGGVLVFIIFKLILYMISLVQKKKHE